MRKTALLAAAFVSFSLAACSGKSLSKDECEKLIDHMTDVAVQGQGGGLSPDMIKAAKDAAKDQMKGMIDECVKEGTRSEYDCAMGAKTVADLEKCTK